MGTKAGSIKDVVHLMRWTGSLGFIQFSTPWFSSNSSDSRVLRVREKFAWLFLPGSSLDRAILYPA